MRDTSAREAARERNGRFGVQERTEIRLRNAELGLAVSNLPTWDDALVHASYFSDPDIEVIIDEDFRAISFCSISGNCRIDPGDGVPAAQKFYPSGMPEFRGFYSKDGPTDPGDGQPALRWYHPNGSVSSSMHMVGGVNQDPGDGRPACQDLSSDGTPELQSFWDNGVRQDPSDGRPAHQTFHPDGTPNEVAHYVDGELQDPSDTTPAVREFRNDGHLKTAEFYEAGQMRPRPKMSFWHSRRLKKVGR